jgi:hypothetical protein
MAGNAVVKHKKKEAPLPEGSPFWTVSASPLTAIVIACLDLRPIPRPCLR